MARENQGLQIALIVTVVFTILFAVLTFVFWKQSTNNLARAETGEKEAGDAQGALRTVQEQFNEFKAFTGFDQAATIDNIREAHKADAKTFATGPDDATNFAYRPALEATAKALQAKSDALAAEQAAVQDLKNRNEALEAQKQTQIKAAEDRAAKAEADLAAQTQKYNADRENLNKQLATVLAQLDAKNRESSVQLAKFEDERKKMSGERDMAQQVAQARSKQLDEARSEKFEVADGRIRWVNQRERTVYIDLGAADGLSRLTTFSVYSSGTNDVADADKKGSIEVTRLLSDHLAEARIVEDEIRNPIMPGDVVNTAIWSPGQREHVALTNGLDMNGDGKSDSETIRNLITMSGGVVDAYIDDEGKLQGQITPETRFLVQGQEPSASATAAGHDVWTKLQTDAERFGVRAISVPELLSRIGWKNDTRVVTFGAGANPADFQMGPADGMERVSRGEVSETFRPRHAPQPRAPGT